MLVLCLTTIVVNYGSGTMLKKFLDQRFIFYVCYPHTNLRNLLKTRIITLCTNVQCRDGVKMIEPYS